MSVRQALVTRVVVSHRNHPNISREHLETLLMRVSIRGTSQKSNALPYFISILSDVNCDRRITGLQLALEQFTAEREAAGMKISTSKEWLILG